MVEVKLELMKSDGVELIQFDKILMIYVKIDVLKQEIN